MMLPTKISEALSNRLENLPEKRFKKLMKLLKLTTKQESHLLKWRNQQRLVKNIKDNDSDSSSNDKEVSTSPLFVPRQK